MFRVYVNLPERNIDMEHPPLLDMEHPQFIKLKVSQLSHPGSITLHVQHELSSIHHSLRTWCPFSWTFHCQLSTGWGENPSSIATQYSSSHKPMLMHGNKNKQQSKQTTQRTDLYNSSRSKYLSKDIKRELIENRFTFTRVSYNFSRETRKLPSISSANQLGWWYTYPSEKYKFVTWDDDSQYWKNA